MFLLQKKNKKQNNRNNVKITINIHKNFTQI